MLSHKPDLRTNSNLLQEEMTHSSSALVDENHEEAKIASNALIKDKGKLNVAGKYFQNKNENETTEEGVSDNENKTNRGIYKRKTK